MCAMAVSGVAHSGMELAATASHDRVRFMFMLAAWLLFGQLFSVLRRLSQSASVLHCA